LPDEPIYLHADPVRLDQVFGNLLNNACKFTELGGRVELIARLVPVRASERRGARDVEVAIRDNGIGIPAEMLTNVFDMFTQVDRTLERSRGGLGIGLTLAKRLVEMHDGTLTAHSDGPGHGSTFTVRLPVLEAVETEAAQPKSGEAPADAARPPSRRILIVDDNEDAATSLEMLLHIAGNETTSAHDGVRALEKAETFRPNVILLDIGLPRMSGYDVCRAIRQKPWGQDVVVIALTGWGQDDDRRKSKDAGFDAHMVKPVDYVAFTKLIGTLKPADKRMHENPSSEAHS
jgi:CheY-like chemotaxis protein